MVPRSMRSPFRSSLSSLLPTIERRTGPSFGKMAYFVPVLCALRIGELTYVGSGPIAISMSRRVMRLMVLLPLEDVP
jgi:hypothetical protein